jgi:uroporphyrinogen-III decarboxylase
MSLLHRHHPDLLWYSGSGSGDKEPSLIKEDERNWYLKDNNTGISYVMTKDSFALMDLETKKKNCDSVGEITSTDDIDKLIPEFKGWGDVYLNGLKKVISDTADQALVLPHHSPAYICACYAFGFEKAMEAMLVKPDLFVEVCERFADGDELRMQQLAGAGAEAVFIAEGWASCDIISPAMIEQFAMPYQKSMITAAHNAGLKIILWNEGDILPILKMESELAMDAFAFEQSRKGVELRVSDVRKVFGNKRCLFGNVDSELMLLRNDPVEIEEEVKSVIQQSGRGCPFIMSSGSPITSDISPEAVDVVMKTTRDFKWDDKK